MKTPTKLILSALLSLGAVAAVQAAEIDFSYTFVDGETINGTIDGTMSNYTMQNVSGIQVLVDGKPLAGGAPLYLGSNDLVNNVPVAGGAVFSQDFSGNNFFISDQADPGNVTPSEDISLFSDSSSSTMVFANASPVTGDTFFNDGSGIYASFGPNFSANGTGVDPQFSLTFVPEPATWALSAIGLTALLLGRRRKA